MERRGKNEAMEGWGRRRMEEGRIGRGGRGEGGEWRKVEWV